MSGLDPVGRREVRELILELRHESRTVVFSSHILSDAESLCSEVGILNRGRLVVSGSLTDLTSAQARAWEIVATMAGIGPKSPFMTGAARVEEVGPGRYRFELDADTRPEPFIAELVDAGAELVSVTPVRTTLEDVFVRAVGTHGPDEAVARTSGASS